jgi:hypothetical protein
MLCPKYPLENMQNLILLGQAPEELKLIHLIERCITSLEDN